MSTIKQSNWDYNLTVECPHMLMMMVHITVHSFFNLMQIHDTSLSRCFTVLFHNTKQMIKLIQNDRWTSLTYLGLIFPSDKIESSVQCTNWSRKCWWNRVVSLGSVTLASPNASIRQFSKICDTKMANSNCGVYLQASDGWSHINAWKASWMHSQLICNVLSQQSMNVVINVLKTILCIDYGWSYWYTWWY